MLWFVLSVACAFLNALYYAYFKELLEKYDRSTLLANLLLISGISMVVISFLKGFPSIGKNFVPGVLFSSFLLIIATELYSRALKVAELSTAVPMLSLTPLFTPFFSFILLGERISFTGYAGIVLIVLGTLVLTSPSLIEPFLEIRKSLGVQLMILVALIYSIASNIEKVLVINSDRFLGYGISYILTSLYFYFKSRKIVFDRNIFKISAVLIMAAFTSGASMLLKQVAYVVAIKRLSSLFSVLLGGVMFKEKGIKKKILGVSIMILGTVILVAE